jgi:hypothetical protein
LNLRPSGYEAPDEGLQADSNSTNPSESLDSEGGVAAPLMQAESSQHKDFGQPVVNDGKQVLDEDTHGALLTPAQAAARFQIPEYLLRKSCAEGRVKAGLLMAAEEACWLSRSAHAGRLTASMVSILLRALIRYTCRAREEARGLPPWLLAPGGRAP